jgi:hypothetical protein
MRQSTLNNFYSLTVFACGCYLRIREIQTNETSYVREEHDENKLETQLRNTVGKAVNIGRNTIRPLKTQLKGFECFTQVPSLEVSHGDRF